MYHCKNCKETFYTPKIINTTYESLLGLLNEFDSLTPYSYEVCPFCESENFKEKGDDDMEREVIDISTSDLTFEETNSLEDYVWKEDKLIPAEIIEGE